MKRFFAILIVLAACLALFCVTAGAEDIPNDVTWEEISSESQLRALGTGTHYAKVTKNITVENSSYIEIYGTLTLDLNGCTITYAPPVSSCDGKSMLYCEDSSNFTLMDSKGGGKLTFAHLGETYEGTGAEAGQTLYARAYAVAVSKNSTFTMKGGTIENFGNTSAYGAAVHVITTTAKQTPTFHMEGGTIQNCKSLLAGTGVYKGSGAAVHIRGANSTFNMTGGTIQNCSSEGNGGAIFAWGAHVSITGGTISGCTSQKNGGAIYAAELAGPAYAKNGPAEITIGGSAQIRGNKASGTYSYGGAVYAENAAITMTGGTIENNGAQNGGNELFLTGSTTFTMHGGKLRHTIDAAAWRTVSLRSSAKLSISDGEIELLNEPYAMELRDTAKLTATGGTVIASGTAAAFDLVSTADVDPEKAATFAGADAETAEFITYPNLTTYAGSKYIKLVPGWKLTLDSNGHGTNPDPIIVPKNYGAKLPMLDDTDGYVCTGWYYDAACTRAYAMEKITADTTLYAGWVQSGSFGLSFSGLISEDGKSILQFDDVTYGTKEADENQTRTFTIKNIGTETLTVELYNFSGVPLNRFYFEIKENGYTQEKFATLRPGEVKTVYVEYSIPSYWRYLWEDTSKPLISQLDDPYWIKATSATKADTYYVYLKRQFIRATATSPETPVLDPNTYPYGTKLSDIPLPDGWSWVGDTDAPLPAGTSSAQAYCEVDWLHYDWTNVDGYDQQTQTVTRDIALKIEKGNATASLFSFTPPTDLIYDGTPKEAAVTALEAPAGYAPYTGTFTVLYNGSATPPIDAGTYQVSISGSGDDCYRSFTALRDESWTFTISPASVTPPAAVTGLVYNGETQTGVVLPENALFTLTGNTAKNAGEYTATASLVSKQNYVWADGTSDDKQIAWSIAKAVLSDITVLMESYAQGKTPSTPALSANPDHAAVRFCYSTRNLNSGGTLWSAEKGKTLSVGVHYIYAELDESENYLAYTTAPTSFVVYTLATGERIRISETKHGYVQAPPSAMPGTAVPVAAEPDKGYVLGSLRVTDESGRSISVTEKADGTYFFIMPDSTAYIDAEFVGNMPFVDVPVSAWYADAVRDAWANGLINGVDAAHFDPDGSLTVAQAIKLAAALHQRIENGTVTLKNGSPWYRSYLEYAVEHGVIEERYLDYSAAALNAPVQRAEFAHILYGAAKPYAAINEIGANALPDVKTGDRYADEIYTLYRAGVLTGSDRSGTFYPTSLIRRSEAAAILIRAFDEEARRTLTLQ